MIGLVVREKNNKNHTTKLGYRAYDQTEPDRPKPPPGNVPTWCVANSSIKEAIRLLPLHSATPLQIHQHNGKNTLKLQARLSGKTQVQEIVIQVERNAFSPWWLKVRVCHASEVISEITTREEGERVIEQATRLLKTHAHMHRLKFWQHAKLTSQNSVTNVSLWNSLKDNEYSWYRN